MLINSKAPYWIDIDNWEEEFEEKSIELDWAVLESLLLKFKSWYAGPSSSPLLILLGTTTS